LNQTIARLASDFADRLLQAIRNAPLADVVSGARAQAPPQKAARPPKGPQKAPPKAAGAGSSGVDIDKSLAELLVLLGKSRDGAQGGSLRKELRLSKGQFLRVAAAGVHSKRVVRVGERRGIKYYLA